MAGTGAGKWFENGWKKSDWCDVTSQIHQQEQRANVAKSETDRERKTFSRTVCWTGSGSELHLNTFHTQLVRLREWTAQDSWNHKLGFNILWQCF